MNKKVLTAVVLVGLLCAGQVHAQKAIFEEWDGSKNGAAVTYDYKSDSLFQVNAKVGNVTDVQFRAGETIGYIAGGDTKRWLIDKAVVAGVPHIYIKPIIGDITTNIIVNTNLRSYRLNVTATDHYDPLIIFNVDDGVKSLNRMAKDEIPQDVHRNYRYKFEAKKKADALLMPEEIFDDGEKTYIRVSEKNKYDMPVLYAVDPWTKKMALVNYRVKDVWLIADKVMEKGRLFFHQKFYIDFENLVKNKMGKKTVYQTPPSRERVYELMDKMREDTIYEAIENEEASYQKMIEEENEKKVSAERDKAYDEEMKQRKDEEKRLQKEEVRIRKEAEQEGKRRAAELRKQREMERKAKIQEEKLAKQEQARQEQLEMQRQKDLEGRVRAQQERAERIEREHMEQERVMQHEEKVRKEKPVVNERIERAAAQAERHASQIGENVSKDELVDLLRMLDKEVG